MNPHIKPGPRSERIRDHPRLIPECIHRVAVTLPVRTVSNLPLPPCQMASELRESHCTLAMTLRERVQSLTMREDGLEVVAAGGAVHPGADLAEDGLQIRASADGRRWRSHGGRSGVGVGV